MANNTFRLSSARLTTLYVVIFAAGITALLASIFVFTARVLDREVDAVIQAEVNGLIDDYRRGGLLQLISTLNLRADSWGRSGAVYLLTDPDGTRIAGNIVGWPTQIDTKDKWIEFEIDASEHGGIVAHPVRAQVFRMPGGRRLLVGTDILERKRLASRLRSSLLWSVGLCGALAALLSYSYSRRVRRRVSSVAATCENIITGDLSQRLAIENTRDEFDELSATVNHMLNRIEQQTAVLRTTFDSAAHDLRAPLYRARVRIEDALQHEGVSSGSRDAMEATLAELERVQRTLGTLLQIAQADGRDRELALEDVDLSVLAREIIDLYRPEAGTHDITLSFTGTENAVLRGNQQLLAQALVNLIENALKYVPAGGRVNVSVDKVADDIILSVADNGPGIPAADRERVMQPFMRLERDREQTGTGLGLSLVASVMRLHRSSAELQDNQPGLLVKCRIPALGR
ncbi:MAG TPA: HAMP domain-containing sensor histidine kinase [Steroidobacteraceae bacterium]|jgi:signal transduction histidine kinase